MSNTCLATEKDPLKNRGLRNGGGFTTLRRIQGRQNGFQSGGDMERKFLNSTHSRMNKTVTF